MCDNANVAVATRSCTETWPLADCLAEPNEAPSMDSKLITDADVARRSRWVARIAESGADFAANAGQLERELADEISREGSGALVGHLRLCGAIPEAYAYDSTAEKLYAKYTDAVIHEAFKAIGLTSAVLTERTDAADVECVCDDYSFVADAKTFRLSRSAKNQKDFKIQALDNWKHGKPYAMVVCPVYQLPSRTSQIYQQAIARSVCVYTYTHLAFLVQRVEDANAGTSLLQEVFSSVEALLPTKSAHGYWQAVNGVLLRQRGSAALWREEKLALLESIETAKEEALTFLARERERIMRFSREQAIQEVLAGRKLDARADAVESVSGNGLLDVGEPE